MSYEKNEMLDIIAQKDAEIAELKRRFGVDKQEAFLEAHANITLKEFAAMLHGRDCEPNLTPNERLLAERRFRRPRGI